MYQAALGLARDAFSIAPDPQFLYMSERHQEALAHLLYGLHGGGGFVLLTGDVGTGKTTICRRFVSQLPGTVNLAYIYNPRLSAAELLATVCEEFHLPVPSDATGGATVKALVDSLNRFLLAQHAQGRDSVLIIDEAQNLSLDVLEQLRLLTNLETPQRKLLQIILIGQPELRALLAQPALLPLAQRVLARYHLRPLDAQDTQHYIAHRLLAAGRSPNLPLPFDAAALRLIHRLTAGVPRRINLLCGRALLGAWTKGQTLVSAATIRQAAREVFDDDGATAWAPGGRPGGWAWRPGQRTGRGKPGPVLAALVLVVALAAGIALWLGANSPLGHGWSSAQSAKPQ